MLSPKTVKHRKQMRHFSKKGEATRGNFLVFGDYGLMSKSTGALNARQIEAARIAMTRSIKRGGKVWIRIFPDFPYTKKPAETRMGNGKGNLEYWICKIKPGTVLFEMTGIDVELARKALTLAAAKLPLDTKILVRDEIV